MRPRILIMALLLLVSATIMENIPVSRTWNPGVTKGDCFFYQTYGIYISNLANTTLTIPEFEYNTTNWLRISITNVSGSIIYQIYTLQFKNGSETSFNFKTNVNPQNESNLKFSDKGVPICASNLHVDDQIPTVKLKINETLVTTYQSGPRETNRVVWNYTDDWGNCYFDKQTGMLVELCRTHQFANNATSEIVWKTDVIKLISTNRWQITQNQQSTSISIRFP